MYTNKDRKVGKLKDALVGADIFIGVSKPNLVTREMIMTMNKPIVFALANPVPEIMPEEALAGGAVIIGTGRSDLPNQINNVLAFPGIFKGALSVNAKEITEEMKIKAAYAIADMVDEESLKKGIVVPDALNKEVADNVAKAVASCCK